MARVRAPRERARPRLSLLRPQPQAPASAPSVPASTAYAGSSYAGHSHATGGTP